MPFCQVCEAKFLAKMTQKLIALLREKIAIQIQKLILEILTLS